MTTSCIVLGNIDSLCFLGKASPAKEYFGETRGISKETKYRTCNRFFFRMLPVFAEKRGSQVDPAIFSHSTLFYSLDTFRASRESHTLLLQVLHQKLDWKLWADRRIGGYKYCVRIVGRLVVRELPLLTTGDRVCWDLNIRSHDADVLVCTVFWAALLCLCTLYHFRLRQSWFRVRKGGGKTLTCRCEFR